jgi:hypothetical protein
MSDTMEYRPQLHSKARKPAVNWLKALLVGLLDRGSGRPTRIGPDQLSGYMLKDIGLSGYRPGDDAASGRSLMDWPIR